MERLLLNSRDELLRIETAKIVYFEADGNYTNIVMTNKLKFALGVNLSGVERMLAERLKDRAGLFARVGKSYIVNLSYVTAINVLKRRLVLSDFEHFAFSIEISKEALKKLKDIITKIKI